MSDQFSIADARNQFAELVRRSEQDPIHITRRGKTVAVIVSIEEYERLQAKQTSADFGDYQNLVVDDWFV